MQNVGTLSWISVVCLLALASEPWADGLAESRHACPGDFVSILPDTLEPKVVGGICASIETARELLGACGLEQHRPITVEVVDDLPNRHVACAGHFDCVNDYIKILGPKELARFSRAEEAFSRLDPDLLFESLVVHEVTHAFVNHSLGSNVTVTAHEYLAYAMQLQMLPEREREAIMDELEGQVSGRLTEVNSFVLAFSPSRFAGNAFEHFRQAENKCSIIERIADGDPDLPFEFRTPDPDLEKVP